MEYIKSKRYKLYTLQGASMHPHLRDGDKVIVSPHRQPRVGDVVVYKKDEDNTFVAHRIIKIDKNTFIAKGDNSFCCDKNMLRQDVLGVVLYVIRGHAVRRFRGGIFLGRLWFLNNAYLLFKEKMIKTPLRMLQKSPVYRSIFFKVLRINFDSIEIKKEIRKELVFKFYSRKRYLAVARIDKQSLHEKIFYIRFIYRGLGLEEKLRTKLAKEIERLKASKALYS